MTATRVAPKLLSWASDIEPSTVEQARRIPSGVGKGHEHAVAEGALKALGLPATTLTGRQEVATATQFGTFGSGNHFGEVCLDEHDRV